MSSRIELFFITKPEDTEQEYAVPSIRLMAYVKFATLDGLTEFYPAMVDTGSPISVVPFKIWARCSVKLFGPDRLASFSDNPECEIPVQAGEIRLVVQDRLGARTDELVVRADLCDTSEVPLILGMHDVLARGVLHADYPRSQVWFEV
jgi:hypothetical protein